MTELEKSSEGFYFLSLSLENVRCFGAKQTLDLSDGNGRPAQWTVILGDNGTGKTTLLNVLSQCIWISHNEQNILRRIKTNNSKILSIFAFNSILANKHKEFLTFAHESTLDGNISGGSISIPNNFPVIEQSQYLSDNSPIGSVIFDIGGYQITNHDLKLFSYSATRRLKKVGNNSPEEKENQVSDTDELINAEKWLLDTDYIASKTSDIQASYKERLTIVKDILIDLLPDVENIRITIPSEKSPNPRVEFQMPDGWLLLSQLSLGYQTMTAWMVDLAARLFNFYPDSPNPIAEPAIVLIDEIDLHLHPKWQRIIMSYLSERFVNTQFIVTSHSPLIVQAAENANIVVLKREVDGVIHQEHQDVHGWRVDQLLTSDLFDLKSARSPHYENLLEQRRQILSKPELSEDDHAQLKTLKAEIGDLPTADTAEDIQAMEIIRRAAQLLKPSL
jgi:predicted ATPase